MMMTESQVKELKLKMEVKDKEIKLLSQYVRKLEEEAKVRDGQRERLLTDASIARSKWNTPLLSQLFVLVKGNNVG